MKRPSFQMYQGDWLSNAKLRLCSEAQRGAWIDCMCLMADSDEYGVLRCSLKELAKAASAKPATLQKLRSRQVLKGADIGERMGPLTYTPRHSGRVGETVTLLPAQDGPIWYSSRMVRDEYIRTKRATQGQSTDEPKVPIGMPSGDHPSHVRARAPAHSSSSSSSTESTTSTTPVVEGPDGPPDCPHEQIIAMYHELLPECTRVVDWTDQRRALLRSRWREKAKPNGSSQGYMTVDQGLEFWRRFFRWVSQSRFLTGKADPKPGRQVFVATLEWLIKPSNFVKVIEGQYHGD